MGMMLKFVLSVIVPQAITASALVVQSKMATLLLLSERNVFSAIEDQKTFPTHCGKELRLSE
jgi:hypothetical protein